MLGAPEQSQSQLLFFCAKVAWLATEVRARDGDDQLGKPNLLVLPFRMELTRLAA
jgi:hypothetical protein